MDVLLLTDAVECVEGKEEGWDDEDDSGIPLRFINWSILVKLITKSCKGMLMLV